MQESVKTLESDGIQNLVFDPCGNAPVQGDFLSAMRENVEDLKAAFAKKETRTHRRRE